MHCHFFFFQAEDGIRDGHVTGVQMCALPISPTYICPSAPMLNSPVRKQITTEAAIISSGVSCATSAEIPTDDLKLPKRSESYAAIGSPPVMAMTTAPTMSASTTATIG